LLSRAPSARRPLHVAPLRSRSWGRGLAHVRGSRRAKSRCSHPGPASGLSSGSIRNQRASFWPGSFFGGRIHPHDLEAMGPQIGAGKLLWFRTPGPLEPRHLPLIPRTFGARLSAQGHGALLPPRIRALAVLRAMTEAALIFFTPKVFSGGAFGAPPKFHIFQVNHRLIACRSRRTERARRLD
jgi:hypothetical protein